MGRPSRGGNICVAQHQPDGVRLLLGRALSLRETLGRLSSWASLVLGDFNTHSTAWGSRKTNGRGRDVQDWAAALDLRLMNRGSTSTCVAWRGESIVDLTWASPAASRRVSGWGVSPEETLSDHLYILMEVAVGVAVHFTRCERANWPTGKEKKIPAVGGYPSRRGLHGGGRYSRRLVGRISDRRGRGGGSDPAEARLACDLQFVYAAIRGRAGAVYWWSEGSARLREACIRARRRYTRSRHRRREDEATVARLYEAYREAWRPLQRAIKEAKRRTWGELLASLDADPRGRPYKIVLNKLRLWAPPATESMDPRFVEEIVGSLFSVATDEEDSSFTNEEEPQPSEEESRDPPGSCNLESGVTEEELAEAVGRIGARKAPAPEGVPTRLWKDVAGVLAPRLMRLFDRCLSGGKFPVLWKEARMVLLPKPGRSSNSPSDYRPVCLLDGAGKLLKRVVAARLESHLSRSVPGLHDSQFVFRRGRSTADTVARVRSARLRGVGRDAGRGQRLQQHSLGQDMPGPRVSSGTRICGVWSGHFSGTEVSSAPSMAGGWLRGRGPAGLRARSAAVEHRVRRKALSADASELGADVLRRRHVSAGLGLSVGRNRSSGGTGCGPRGRRDQGIGAEGVPWEVRGNVVLPQGRSRDASSGLSPEVGGGWDRGRNQHEISGSDPRQSLDLPRSFRSPGTVCRGNGERIRTFAASAGWARRRSAPAVWSSDLGRGPDG